MDDARHLCESHRVDFERQHPGMEITSNSAEEDPGSELFLGDSNWLGWARSSARAASGENDTYG
jgi:hypothetical protein